MTIEHKLKDEPKTAQEVLARARATYTRIVAQRQQAQQERQAQQMLLERQAQQAAKEQELAKLAPPKPPRLPPEPWRPFRPRVALDVAAIRIVARAFNLHPGDIIGSRRNAAITLPRQIAMWITRTLAEELSPNNYSMPRIGKRFGGRDHTTVLHALRKIELLLHEGALSREFLDGLIAECREAFSRSIADQRAEFLRTG
jgi:hypothetical protein